MTLVADPAAPSEPEEHPPPPPAVPPRGAVVMGNVGRALLFSGIVAVLFVVFLLWGTDIQEARAQDDLRDDLRARFDDAAHRPAHFVATAAQAPDDPHAPGEAATADDPETPPQATADGGLDPDEFADALALLFPAAGDALAGIEIPAIGLDKVVVGGVGVADLRKGPGHYPQTPLPGNAGNTGIAGHRTTYGKPFNRIDELEPGDEIIVTSVQGEFVYRVLDPLDAYADVLDDVLAMGAGHVIVRPSDTWVLGDFGDDRLTLTACHPELSSRQRIIVAAELVDDPVEVPGWAIEANQGRAAAPDDGAPADPPAPADGDALAHDITATGAGEVPPSGDAPDLDEGLGGESDALVPAAAWMAAAVAAWYLGGWLGRRSATGRVGRFGLRLVGLIPALLCLWVSFHLLDRALPAG